MHTQGLHSCPSSSFYLFRLLSVIVYAPVAEGWIGILGDLIRSGEGKMWKLAKIGAGRGGQGNVAMNNAIIGITYTRFEKRMNA